MLNPIVFHLLLKETYLGPIFGWSTILSLSMVYIYIHFYFLGSPGMGSLIILNFRHQSGNSMGCYDRSFLGEITVGLYEYLAVVAGF